jgi:uncharacterized protein YgiM (DUF1202 family)
MVKATNKASSGEKKLDIDDIKEPGEEIDLESAISEDDLKEKKEEPKEPEEKSVEDAPDVLETAQNESEQESPIEPTEEVAQKIKNKRKINWKVILLILLTMLVTGALVLAGVYFYSKKKQVASKTETPIEQPKEEVPAPSTPTKMADVYVNVAEGLRLRKEPSPTAEILDTMPFGTKLTPLDTQGDWIKAEYNSKTGWCMVSYTGATNPLVYENKTYGFKFTFLPSWAGYKFFEAKNSGSTLERTYYVALPTTDKGWDETSSGITKGYASLFVMGVYTKAEWANLQSSEIKPGKLGESDKYVYTYLPGQAHATDLKNQYGEINQIIKTFEALK